jgi:hypothetical protein
MTVQVTFETPSGNGPTSARSFHERRLEDIPAAIAEQMMRDFRQYCADQRDRSPLYRYEQDGEEVLLALDFDEIVELIPLESPDAARRTAE